VTRFVLCGELPYTPPIPEPMAPLRYPRLPATLLGRLAVSLEQRGQGLGEILLLDALARALSSEIASFAVAVDPTDDAARRFYERYRFLPLGLEERRLFLPMSEIALLLS
jgi:predicted GNAT family N-acyltransferase